MLWVGVAGEMRFGEKCEAGDAAFAREFMPDGIDHLQIEIADDALENRAERIFVSQLFGITFGGLDQPFGSNDHLGQT